jgi:hypothetical protein
VDEETFEDSEMLDSEEAEADEVPSRQDATYWRKRAEKAEKQAVERKLALRRLEVASKHGASIGDIPDWVQAEHLEEFAERFLARPTPTETEQHEPAPEEAQAEEPAQSGLAAVAKAPSIGKPAPEVLLTVAELKELNKTDPIRAEELRRQGKYVQQTSW